MSPNTGLKFLELSNDESVALLERNAIGRIAFSYRDRVDIEPISYVYDAGWIYGRTSSGTKLSTIAHSRWVAFEVDEIADRFNWRSVTVHGALYLLDGDETVGQRAEYAHALEVIRSLDADAMAAGDATPHRTCLFRIHVDGLVGRAAGGH